MHNSVPQPLGDVIGIATIVDVVVLLLPGRNVAELLVGDVEAMQVIFIPIDSFSKLDNE